MNGFFTSELRLTTTDAAETRLRQLYGDVRLEGLGGYRETVAGDAAFTIAQLDLDGTFHVAAEVDAITLAFSSPGFLWRVGREEGDPSVAPVLFQPGDPMANRIEGGALITTVAFDVPALTDLARWVYGEDVDVRFTGPRAVNAAAGEHATRLAAFVRDGGALGNDLARASAHHALAVAVLEGFPLVGDRARRTRTAEARLRAFRRASRYIDDHLSLPITQADVARAAGVPEIELQSLFRAHSPDGSNAAGRLLRGRIAAAHRDLVEGDPTLGDSVRRIASRWGFPHPGRFAAAYRRQYGVDPKYVLDR